MNCSHDIRGIWTAIEPGHHAMVGHRCINCNETWKVGCAPFESQAREMTPKDTDDYFMRMFGVTQEQSNIFDDEYPDTSTQPDYEKTR